MSNITVNSLSNSEGTGAITFPTGIQLAADTSLNANSIIITGVATATSFSGDGSTLTNLPGVSVSEGIALSFIT